jgi:hypothetical protein
MKLKTGPAGPVSCCVGRDNVMVHVGATKEMIAFRLIGTACTKYNSSDECSGMQCDFGPCGAAIQGFTTDTVGPPANDARVFHPKHAVKACGFQAEVGPGLFSFYPEKFVDQLEYPKVTPSCPYTTCVSRKEPGITITVTGVADGASGSVNSEPPGLSVDGAGTASKAFAEPVELTAKPNANARAVFSGGGCDIVGDYGHTKSCHVALAPDPQVTVTYQCKPGEHCEH